MKKLAKHLIGTAGFFLVGFLLLLGVRELLGPEDEYAEMRFRGYYREAEDVLDVVFVGNSHIYRYWQSPFAWEEYGMASSQLTISAMPGSIVKNTAVEALKTQSPEVLVVDLTTFANEDEENNKVHMLLDNMKLSMNYLDTVENYCKYSGVTGTDKLQYYFPIMQFHSRWKELGEGDFSETKRSYMNANYQQVFLEKQLGKNKKNPLAEGRAAIGPQNEAALRDFLEWCGGQDTKILFLAVPVLNAGRQEMIHTAADIVEEAGFEVVNYNEKAAYESLGLEEATDFSDMNHTNIKGSYKFTLALGKYLMETYGLKDRRGEAGYETMDKESEAYCRLVGKYLASSDEK